MWKKILLYTLAAIAIFIAGFAYACKLMQKEDIKEDDTDYDNFDTSEFEID
jgi:hypothetical protein